MEKHIMKNSKLIKIGVSALCGSLATISAAQAGEILVKGSAQTTYTKASTGTNGNPLGMNTGLTFVGSGELDGGTAVTYTLTHADKAAYSAGSLKLATPGLGTFTISHASGGGGIGAYDDKMPTAWEESWGNVVGTSVNLQKGVGSSSNIQWASPSMMGTTLKVAWAPKNDGSTSNDKATGGETGSSYGRGLDIVLDMKGMDDRLNVWVGGSHTKRHEELQTAREDREDHYEANIGGTVSIGPVKLGYAKTYEDTGNTLGGEVDYYQNDMYGISVSLGDNLSLSANRFDSQKNIDGRFSPEMQITSLQAAYTMGGAAWKIAKTEADNSGYSVASESQKDATTVALSMAF
jgi:hypothetical protein